MKKFTFSLEALLKMRSRNVDARKAELGKVVSLKEKRLNDIAGLDQKRLATNNGFKPSGLAVYGSAYQDYKRRLDKEKREIEEEIKKIEEVEAVRRANLSYAMQQEKVIEKLKEKKIEEYKKEVEKEESETMDEIAQRITSARQS